MIVATFSMNFKMGIGSRSNVQNLNSSLFVIHLSIVCDTSHIHSYLIFVIFFTQTRFFENKIYTEERVNYDKQISRQNSVN